MAKAAAGKIKVVAIIGSLAALALILSPTFSALSFPGGSANNIAGANSLLQDEVIAQDTTVVENTSDEDLAACTSVNDRIDEILGVVDGQVDDRKVASDTLIAEYCARPVLIHEIKSSFHAPMSLVAYACDASSGRIGTAAMKDSLSDHKQIYCDSARELIINETNTFQQSVEEFRTVYLPMFEADLEDESQANTNSTEDSGAQNQSEATAPYFNVTSVEISLDEITQSLEETMTLVDENEYYAAAKSFDNASKKFIGLFEETES